MEGKNSIWKGKEMLLATILFSLIIFLSNNVLAVYNNPSNVQYSSPDLNKYYSGIGFDINTVWSNFDNPDKCEASQDFIINIIPGSCMPAVVRSDLLEEQNVPVFCKMAATKINPLIATNKIKRVYIKTNNQSSAIAGASYYPSKSAIGAHGISVDNPLITDVGYVVVNLKSMAEKDMPDSVIANLTAVIEYDVENAFGIGQGAFYLPLMDENEWSNEYVNYGFWKGKGFLRLEYVNENEVRISIYRDKTNLYKSFVVQKGQTSDVIFMPGFYCQAGLKINFVGQELPKTRALLEVDGVSGWVTQGEKVSDGCTINSIDKEMNQVEITCRGKKAILSVGFSDYVKINDVNVKIGSTLNVANQDYLLYYGKTISLDEGNSNKDKKDFIVIAKDVRPISILDGTIKQATLDNIDKIVNAKLETNLEEEKFVTAVSKAVASELGIDADKIVIIEKGTNQELLLEKSSDGTYKFVRVDGGKYTFDDLIYVEREKANYGADGDNIEKYFAEAENTEKEIVDSYKNEKIAENGNSNYGDYYGAVALNDLATTAGLIGKQITQKELLEKLIQDYPDSNLISEAQRNLESLKGYDYSSATSFFEIDGKTHIITLKTVKYPNIDEASAEFDVYDVKAENMKQRSDVKGKIGIGEQVYKDEKVIVTLKDISQNDKATISYKYINKDGNWVDYNEITISTSNDKPTTISEGDISIKLVKVNAEYLAKINVVPEIKNGKTQSDFIVQVGIEKRAIQLSPEETKKRIQNLNKTINQLEKTVESLGNLVKTWKLACYATSIALNVKNMFANTGGAATARQHVMQDAGGWTDECKDLMKKDPTTYPTIDICFAKKAPDINKDVEATTTILNNLNTNIKTAKGALTNEQAIANSFATSYFNGFVSQSDKKFVDKKGESVAISSVFGDPANVKTMIDTGQLTLQEMRDIMFASQLSSVSEVMQDVGTKNIQGLVSPIYSIQQNIAAAKTLNNDFNEQISEGKDLQPTTITDEKVTRSFDANIIPKKEQVPDPKDSTKTITEIKNYVKIIENSKGYIVPVKETAQGSNQYVFDNSNTKGIFNLDSNDNTIHDFTKVIFTGVSPKMCQNSYEIIPNINDKIAVYDTEPNKGLPQLVPFDLKEGWYIATKPTTISLTVSTSAYTSSGMLSSFWLCNVGPNKREEFERGQDDICTKIDMNSNQPLDKLPCLTSSQAVEKIRIGITTVEKVSNEYAKGSPGIYIDKKYFKFERAVNVPNLNCQDFMSPGDCTLLYNVCDPVLCPASRCNLGGKWKTTDVIQEGLIGSLVLCLPNAGKPSEGGVVVPICLTGVQAGLDAWTSVLKAHRDCLQENLNTGKMTGICDEMYSIYLCDFFWRQLAPVLRIGIPKIIEGIVYKRSQGGGEYLTVQDSWKNMENSFNYFTNVYGVNAFNAFKKRSTGNIGAEVCKSFISANYPSSADTLNQLLEPESPVQFFARFDEIPFSDATVAPTSQYKVYYHIYAGKDAGVNYQIYLKASSASTQYFNLQNSILVKTGYVTQGSYATDTKDFTAPAGYKELCVSLNDQEKCGFGQVTTEYAMNYLTDQYAVQQANKTNINSEAECISGSSSKYSLVNPNIQEGVSNLINPDISSSLGITRICSTGEPGGATGDVTGATYSSTSGTTANWLRVGYCDKANNIICWADKASIENVIKNTELEAVTLENLQTSQNALFEALNIHPWTEADEDNQIKKIEAIKPDTSKGEEPSQAYLKLINEFIQRSGIDNSKAMVLYTYKFDVYNKLVKFVFGKYQEMQKTDAATTAVPTAKTNVPITPTTIGILTLQQEITSSQAIYRIYQDDKITNFYFDAKNQLRLNRGNWWMGLLGSDPILGTRNGDKLAFVNNGATIIKDGGIDITKLQNLAKQHYSLV